MMKTIFLLGLVGSPLVLVACDYEPAEVFSNASSSSGAGGEAGAAGKGGNAGNGGTAGNGGIAGNGGAAGTGGIAGNGGAGGGVAIICGDGKLDPPLEECDDGNKSNGDGCNAMCQFEPQGQSCGNVKDPGEKCDDGNTLNGDGCNPTCNFFTKVTELGINVPGTIITSDGTYLYTYGGMTSNCQIHRVPIAQCMPGNCVFTPFVGAGCLGAPADGPGATAVLGAGGAGLAFGAGKLFFGGNQSVRSVDLSSPTLDVVTVAGNPMRCGQLDGIGNMAVMSDVRGLVFYNGLLYYVDANMATLRSIDPNTGTVTTLAGQSPNDNSNTNFNCATNLCCGNMAPAMDGMGTAAIMNSPRYMTQDNAGNLYIIDTNGSAIRHYTIATNMLSTVISGMGYMDGVGGGVRVDRPRGITSDGTSLYFGEQNLNTIRQTVLGTSTTSTFVGVRGCAGPANLMGMTGGDGSQDWSANCNAVAVAAKPKFAVGSASMTFDYGSKSIYAIVTGNRLLRIE